MLKTNIRFILSLLLIIAILIISIFANYLAPFDPNKVSVQNRLMSPNKTYVLGTDALGRDLFSRILYGGRTSIILALVSSILAMLIGLLLGIIAGYYGGVLDSFITGFGNVFEGIPSTAFMIALAGIFEGGVKVLLIGLLIISWNSYCRIARVETIKLKEEEFIEGLIMTGCSDFSIMFKHILPNFIPNIAVLFTTRIGRSLLTIASLSYLGFGIQPPTSDWSIMIFDARMNFRSAPYLLIFPGIPLIILLWSLNMLGDSLRDIFDKRSMELRD